MEFTHLDENGAKMVDVGAKSKTNRTAIAFGSVKMQPETIALIKDGKTPKGDVFNTARIAGIQAAKKTSELIPLCHNIFISCVKVDFAMDAENVYITALASANSETGVEMEALTAVSVAALTVYDMAKAVDKSMTISSVSLIYKSGGKSGVFVRGKEQGYVKATNVSTVKGSVKHPVGEVELVADFGILGDCHAEKGSTRQISLLGEESIDKMRALGVPGLCFGKFAENFTTEGISLHTLPVGTKLLIGNTLHVVTQIGKKCHAADGCEVARTVGTCIMPKEGIFTRVLLSGPVRPTDKIYIID